MFKSEVFFPNLDEIHQRFAADIANDEALGMAPDYSHWQYMALAYQESELAIREGNKPIGAVLSVQYAGIEILYADHNRSSERRTDRHAEDNVLVRFEAFMNDGDVDAASIIRDAPPDSNPNKVLIKLYTTLEPCSKCAGRIATVKIGIPHYKPALNLKIFCEPSKSYTYGIDEIIIEEVDPKGGALLNSKINNLPGIFRSRFKYTVVQKINHDDPKSPYYIPKRFKPSSYYVNKGLHGQHSSAIQFAD